MKIRNGFVSNSSSSSFIVASKGSSRVKLILEIDLAKYGDKIETIEQLNEYFIKKMYVSSIEKMLADDRDDAERYNKCLKAIKEGKTIIVGSFGSDSGEPVEQFLCENGLENMCPEDVELIYGTGGY